MFRIKVLLFHYKFKHLETTLYLYLDYRAITLNNLPYNCLTTVYDSFLQVKEA